MVLLCFVIDLTWIQPYLLGDLKQCLLQLSNLYALRKSNAKAKAVIPGYDPLSLCFIKHNNVSGLNELKVAYCRKGNFNLRDFHHAVNSLSVNPLSNGTDIFDSSQSYEQVSCLESLWTKEEFNSWAPPKIHRKIIMISSYFVDDISLQKMSKIAAENCVNIEFIQIETDAHPHSSLGDFTDSVISEKNKSFILEVSELENCFFRKVKWDAWNFFSFVKSWLQDIKDDIQMKAFLLFKDNLIDSTKKIICNLYPSMIELEDKFKPCQTCRCHGAALDTINMEHRERGSLCPVTGQELDDYDLTVNGLNIGPETVLLLPSFMNNPELETGLTEIALNVAECVTMTSLNEGLFFGSSYILAASNYKISHSSESHGEIEANIQNFSALCQVLDSKDCALICTSNSDIDYKREINLPCFYALLPFFNGSMLLRRIASSEEILPVRVPLGAMAVSEELKCVMISSLEKMGTHDYNPLNYERGCHTKLNNIVKSSLQFRMMPVTAPKSAGELYCNNHNERHHQNLQTATFLKDGMHKTKSPSQLVKEQIPSIIQRMEPLKNIDQIDIGMSSNSESGAAQHQKDSSSFHNIEKNLHFTKKPLIPFKPSESSSLCISPKLKPNFRRIKRIRT